MTQASDRKPLSTNRRSARTARNRPVLVAPATSEDNADVAEDASTASTIVEEQEQPSDQLVEPKKSSGLKLPKFFSTVGKKEQAQEQQEDTVARGRLARATRGKNGSTPAKAPDDARPEVSRAAARPVASARPRPAGAFKTRYLIGMGLYLIGANFIGIFITNFFRSQHMDSVLARFPLFGSNVVISTSTLVYLAILVILLVVLARLDLIPRSFSSLGGQSTAARGGRGGGGSGSKSDASDNARSAPPTMKQGVKGANDDLYQQYRANQRRERKK
jgi:hypothetical protein